MTQSGNPLETTTAPTEVPTNQTSMTRHLMAKNVENLKKLQDFDPKTLPDHFAMVVYGIRRRGKTFMIKEMLYHLKDRFDRAYLFSSTADLQPEQYDFIDEDNLYGADEIDKLQSIVSEQETMLKHDQGKAKKDCLTQRTLIIFDDFIQNKKIARNNEAFTGLYTRGRHCHITVIALVQSRTGIPPAIRSNVDCIIAFEAVNGEDRKVLMNEYLSASDLGYKEGCCFFNSVTQELFTALAINNTIKGNREVYGRGFRYRVPEKQRKYIIGKKGKKQNKNEIENIQIPASVEPASEFKLRKNTFKKKGKGSAKNTFSIRLSDDPSLKVRSINF